MARTTTARNSVRASVALPGMPTAAPFSSESSSSKSSWPWWARAGAAAAGGAAVVASTTASADAGEAGHKASTMKVFTGNANKEVQLHNIHGVGHQPDHELSLPPSLCRV